MQPANLPSSSLFAAVRSSVLATIARKLDDSRQNTDLLLRRHGISRSLLDDPYGAVPMGAYLAFFDDAAVQMRDPALGARLGLEIRAGDVGPVGILLSLSSSIATGLHRFARYTSALQHMTEASFVETADAHVFSYRIATDKAWPREQDAEFSMVSLMQILRSGFGSRIPPLGVQFEHPAPADTSVLEKCFRCPLQFGQAANRILIDPEFSKQGVRVEDEPLITALERHIAELIGLIPEADTVTQQIEALVSATLGRAPVTLVALAARMGESPRTLQRKLSQEGTSLRQIVTDRRRATADRLLALGTRVGDVATALGYADGTAFWRARKGWEENAPGPQEPDA